MEGGACNRGLGKSNASMGNAGRGSAVVKTRGGCSVVDNGAGFCSAKAETTSSVRLISGIIGVLLGACWEGSGRRAGTTAGGGVLDLGVCAIDKTAAFGLVNGCDLGESLDGLLVKYTIIRVTDSKRNNQTRGMCSGRAGGVLVGAILSQSSGEGVSQEFGGDASQDLIFFRN